MTEFISSLQYVPEVCGRPSLTPTSRELQQLPPELHLLCPRSSPDDADRYDEDIEGIDLAEIEGPGRSKRVKDARARRNKFMSSLQLLAYDGSESEQYQRYIWERIDEALGNCDICIRNYYVARMHFLSSLREEYEEDDINLFFDIIHRRDISRITDGLEGAKKTLQSLPEAKRGTSSLDMKHLHAIFEALVCEKFLKDEALVARHFDEPFRLIQSKKPLRIREILPATVRFLFDRNHFRLNWANSIWGRIDRSPTKMEWNWALRDYLEERVRLVTEPGDITRLWSALKVIVDKLDARLITFQLLDLQPNICLTALNHLNKPTSAVPFITQTIQIILSKAPEAFWQAMGTISAQTIVEQIFNSPQLNNRLQESAKGSEKQSLDVLSWAPVFINSLKLESRPAACQAIVTQLLSRIESQNLPIEAKRLCFDSATRVLRDILVAFADSEKNRQSVERVILRDTLNIVSHRIDQLLRPEPQELRESLLEDSRKWVLEIVKNSLALECQCLKNDFDALSQKQRPKHESSSYSPEIWDAVLARMNDADFELSQHILLGLMALPGLELLRIKGGDDLVNEKKSFNSIFEKLTGAVAKVLDKVADFSPDHLDALFKKQESSMALVAALFSADETTYNAAVALIKNISGDSSRKDALSHLIEAFRNSTIYSLCWTLRRISTMRTFASIPRMLKSGMEILDVLCNQTDGQLRSLKHFEHREFGAIENYWSYQWAALMVVFRQMEKWSLEVHDKVLMSEVCRDAMQYAEELFEQYDLFTNVLETARPGKAAEIRKTLLDHADSNKGSPVKTIDAMSKWLRLRDQFLADTLVKLLTKMLYRLKKHEATSEIEGLAYVEQVATTNEIKTMLSDTQKATLIRALEHYHGKQLAKSLPVRKKQSTLRDWTSSSVEKVEGISISSSRDQSLDIYEDSDIADEDFYEVATALKSKEKERSKLAVPSRADPSKVKKQDAALLKAAERQAHDSKAFIDRRKREEAARKLRDKEVALKLRGKTGIGAETSDQGSGLAGIGVIGKEHTAGQSSLMLSSDSESDGDSDEELFGMPRPELTQSGRPVNIRKVIPTGPVRKVKQVRSQKDVRARLAPDLSSLHKTLLSWDFFADTDLPPTSAKDDYTLVSNTFSSAAEYQKTFEPLLVLEAWQSFRSAREDGTFKPFEFKVANSLIVDSFFEINVQMSLAQGQELGISTADVVLLSKAKRPETSPDEPHCLARVKEVTRKKGEMQIVYRVNAANNPLRPFLSDKSSVFGAQILSLTPLEREYGALMALPYYDLCDEIISAKPSPLLDYPESELASFVETYDVNKAQAKAVRSALDNDAFTLIQGPPGSGKTKTICALVGAMMTGFVNKQATNGPRLNTANARAPPAPAPKKILVCAPSNAAVDELVMRFKQGVKMRNGSTEKLSVVRLGRSEAINAQVKDVTLEELVNARLDTAAPKDPKEDVHAVMMEHKATSESIIELRNRMDSMRAKNEIPPQADENAFDGLKRKKAALGNKIDSLREKQNIASRDAELNRKRIQQEILDGAHVLCATLSGSGHEIFQGLNVEFETVIIDEAAQSIELSALIPLKYGCSKCILVGDPKQLPPTVLSREAAKFQYEQSLFARMENNHKKDVHLLDTQYRMHPEISLFPSRMFYDSRLKDGPDMARLRARPWHSSSIFAPYRFFDVQGMSESAPKSHSLINIAELNVAMQLYDRLTTDVPKYNFKGKIGIITPYKGQLKELRYRFKQRYGDRITSNIEFNTTDAFQGRESEIIIFSCVRASTRGIGFLNDIRRMNVGLTRAKCSLWVLGNSTALMQGEFWRGLVNDARSRSLYTDGDIHGLLSRPLLTEDMMKDDVEMTGMDEPRSEVENPSDSGEDPAPDPELEVSKSALGKQAEAVKGASSANTSVNPTPNPSRPASALSRKSSSSSVMSIPWPEPPRRDSGNHVNAKNTPIARKANIQPPKTQQSSMGQGPSGGRFGLNELANCRICGSDTHFTYGCDNKEAKEAVFGNCDRCFEPGHKSTSCNAPRCLECGEAGHDSRQCLAPIRLRLTPEEKQDVERQETRFAKAKERAKEKKAARQLSDHGAKIPEVKASLPVDTPTEPKRKREGGDPPENAPKAPRMGDSIVSGPKPATMNGSTNGPGGRPTMAPQAAMIRKKKADPNAMFVKRK